MSILAHPRPFVPPDPALEALALQDVGVRPVGVLDDAVAWPEPDPDDYPSSEDFERMSDHNAQIKREGAGVPDYSADVARLRDDALIQVLAAVDEGSSGRGYCYFLGIETDAAREAYLATCAAEVVRRLDARQPVPARAA